MSLKSWEQTSEKKQKVNKLDTIDENITKKQTIDKSYDGDSLNQRLNETLDAQNKENTPILISQDNGKSV